MDVLPAFILDNCGGSAVVTCNFCIFAKVSQASFAESMFLSLESICGAQEI